MNLIFVYGTLKRGCYNHNKLLKNETFIGPYKTVEKYPLVLTCPRFSPVMFPEPGIGHKISGEVYKVDDKKLYSIDKFEYIHLPNGFKRHKIHLESRYGSFLVAEAYFRQRKFVRKICSDYLESYDDDRYVSRDER